MKIACVDCATLYPDEGAPFRCPACGGVFDYAEPLRWQGDNPARAGLGQFERTLGSNLCTVSMGEANTPLVASGVDSRKVYFKCEYANPSGSFKDRGAAALVSFLLSRNVSNAIEDSSGNAGAAFAAYAARAGIRATVYVPESASGPKQRQIQSYGANLISVPGERSRASDAAIRAVQDGAVYASHAWMPQQIMGYSTCAFEIARELPTEPGAVFAPVGQGGLLLGLALGFGALRDAGVCRSLPQLIGVQAAGCAPLAAAWDPSNARPTASEGAGTVAEGAKVEAPLRSERVVTAVRESGGTLMAVAEEQILPGRDSLARMGFYVEPTSALVWPALTTLLPQLPDPVVAVLTGSGYKAGLH
jgi:threonine synthase